MNADRPPTPYRVLATTAYRRDQRKLLRQGKNFFKLEKVLHYLVQGHPLPVQYRDHTLTGTWAGHRDCHVEPDWLLIYRDSGDTLILARTSSHAELFSQSTGPSPSSDCSLAESTLS